MGNDDKQFILNYMTGNVETESGDNTAQIEDNGTSQSNLLTYINTQVNNVDFTIEKELSLKNASGEELEYTLLHIQYRFNEDIEKSLFIILDNEFSPVATIKNFTSGVDFGLFYDVDIDENGFLYGIDNLGNTVGRFVMMTNIGVNQIVSERFEVGIRITYNLDNTYFTYSSALGTIQNVKKDPTEATYVISSFSAITGRTGIALSTTFKINVGSANEYVMYYYEESEVFYKAIQNQFYTDGNNNRLFRTLYSTDLSGEYEMLAQQAEGEVLLDVLIDTGNENVLIVGNDIYSTIYSEQVLYFYKTPISTGTKETIKTISIDETSRNYLSSKILNTGELVMAIIMTKGVLVYEDEYKRYYYNYISLNANCNFNDGNWFQDVILDTDFILFKAKNTYNYYRLYFNSNNYKGNAYLIYNSNNYNGVSYLDYNYLKPQSSILYDENDDIIFARNLTNISSNVNISTAVLNVPNTLLNDILISQQDLISQTSNVAISNTDTYKKNIYENVNFNFITTLNMQNQNNPNNIITNVVGATRINQSVNSLLDYTNAQITYYRLVNSDYTYIDSPISKEDITYNTTTNTATFKIAFYKTSNLSKIQIMSGDKTTTYLEIDVSAQTNDKYYTINQEMEVV